MGALRGDANELAVRPKMVYMVVEARVVGAVGVRDPPVVDHGALVVVQGLPTIKFPMSRGQHARHVGPLAYLVPVTAGRRLGTARPSAIRPLRLVLSKLT